MHRVTCSHEDCPTPHFYVDLDDGQVILAHTPVVDAFAMAIGKAQASAKEVDVSLMEELNKSILEFQGEKNQLNTGLTESEKIDYDDYLVVYCDSSHKNYMLTKRKD